MDAWCDGQLTIDPTTPLDVATRPLPARWAVYLMRDESGRPVQLLSVKNVRASVRRRLGEGPAEGPSKKIDYRSVVRQVCWKRVDSAFESDLAYFEAARAAFPDTFRNVMPLRRPAFLHVNPQASFPRWTRTSDPFAAAGLVFGPLAEQQHASKLIETLEDLFDLCRYYSVLAQAPKGSPCAYKDMGKCPAPCDGSISMQQYRRMIDWSIATLTGPAREIEQQTDRMREAAGELRFETAAKIKQFVDGLSSLGKGHWRQVRPLTDLRFLSVQAGPAKGKIKLFAVRPEGVKAAACLVGEPREVILRCADVADLTGAKPRAANAPAFAEDDADRISLIAKYLFWPKSGGVFLHGDDLTDRAIAAAYKQVSQQKAAEATDEDDEGVVAELAVGGEGASGSSPSGGG